MSIFHAGYCDDLSILYAALLESVGIETAFITVPGHIPHGADRKPELEVRHGESKHTEPKRVEAPEVAISLMDYRPYVPGEATDSSASTVAVS